jgi:hypothetical protein
MGLKTLLDEYKKIKQKTISNSQELVESSQKISDLSLLVSKFYLEEINKINNFNLINECLTLSSKLIEEGATVNLENNFFINFSHKNNKSKIKLLTPVQLCSIFNENWTDTELISIELFLANPQNFIGVNLGLFLKKQA